MLHTLSIPLQPTEKPSTPNPTDPPMHSEHTNDLYPTSLPISRLGKAQKMRDPEDERENEEEVVQIHQSSATFAAVVGLSCGALVIMIVIVIAMVMRKTRAGYNATKTVLVEGEGDPMLEKRHLANMQKNGYENPTYKFYAY